MIGAGAEGLNVKVDRSIRLISVSICDDLLDVGYDLRHVLRDSGDHCGQLNVESPHVFHELVLILSADFREFDLRLTRLLYDLIIDISDIHNHLTRQSL